MRGPYRTHLAFAYKARIHIFKAPFHRSGVGHVQKTIGLKSLAQLVGIYTKQCNFWGPAAIAVRAQTAPRWAAFAQICDNA